MSSHNYATLGAIAALGFIAACVSHEVVGHGGMCLLLGGHITLISSVYFRCFSPAPAIDAAGPCMNLVVGVICWLILRAQLRLSSPWRLFFALTMAFNLFWGTGYLIYSAVTDTGDWAFVLRDLGLHPHWLWRGAMGLVGLYLYLSVTRLNGRYLPEGTPLLLPYLTAGAVCCLAACFFAGPVLPAVVDSARESFASNIGLLLLAYGRRHLVLPEKTMPGPAPGKSWILAGVVAVVIFAGTLGRGLIFLKSA